MTPRLKNGLWGLGWADVTGSIQKPEFWGLDWSEGQELYDGQVTSAPEVRHLSFDHLPGYEHDKYIRMGEWVLKIFRAGYPIITTLDQQVSGFEVGETYALVLSGYNDTYHQDGPPSPNPVKKRAARVRLFAGANEQWFDERNFPGYNGDYTQWYDAYHTLRAEFTADAETMTVGIELYHPWTIHHNCWFLDGVTLEKVDQPSEPDVDYEVLVRVPAQSEASFQKAYQDALPSFSSIVPSHDDAGRLCDVTCPSGQGGQAILYDIPQAQRQAYLDYYTERYSKAIVLFHGDEGNGSEWERFLLWQGDPRWADHVYAGGECHTLASQGCWITCCAMAMRVLGIDPDATPVSVDQELGPDGYTGCLMLHSMMPLLGIEVAGSTVNKATAARHLDAGGLLFIEVEPPSMMHFVLGVTHRNGDFLVLDPYKHQVGWLSDLYEGAEAYRLIAEVENTPPPPPPQPSGVELVGLHLQSLEGGWDTFYRRANDYSARSIAKVFSPEDVLHVLRQCPDANVIVRPYVPNQAPYLYPENDDFAHAAKLWVDHMRDTMYRVCDTIAREFPGRREPYFIYEGPNEEYENVNTDKNQRACAIDTAVAKEVYETGYPIRAGIYCAAVGNLDATQFHLLAQMSSDTRRYEPWWGYHGYFLKNQAYGGPDHLWQYLAGRFEEIQKVLPYQVPWYFGEGGAIGGESSPPEPFAAINDIKAQVLSGEKEHIHYIPLHNLGKTLGIQATDGWVAMYPNDGWRHPEVYNGDWVAHQDDLALTQAMAANAVKYFMGQVVFTSCANYMGWSQFRVKSPQMEALSS